MRWTTGRTSGSDVVRSWEAGAEKSPAAAVAAVTDDAEGSLLPFAVSVIAKFVSWTSWLTARSA